MKLIPAGRMRHWVTIQAPGQSAADQFGATVETYTDVGHVPAEVLDLGGTELWRAQQVHAEGTVQVQLWYFSGLTPAYRFLFGTRVLNILHVCNDVANRQMQCVCRERLEPQAAA
jgi:SPP1 family predicted phage head-tail adaptor